VSSGAKQPAIRSSVVQHGFAANGTPMYERTAAERHWERILALFRETLA
jgi:dienelactone hydrolase